MYQPPQPKPKSLFNWLIEQLKRQKKEDDELVDALSKLNMKKNKSF